MLILTRRAGQRILIGDDIVVSVLELEGSRVKIGIDAPSGVVILREEIEARPGEGQSGANVPSDANDSARDSGNDGADGQPTVRGSKKNAA